MSFVVNGVTIKNPSAFKVERYNVTTMERLSNAKMVGDLIAKKRKFYFTYDAITGEDLDNIFKAIDSTKLFYKLTYPEDGTDNTASAEVYVGSMPYELHRMGTKSSVWKNVTFNLIER